MPLPKEILDATVKVGKRLIVADVESDGLLEGMSGGGDIPPMTQIHSATVEDLLTGEHFEWDPETIHLFPGWLEREAGVIVGHNFISFDIRAIKWWCDKKGIPFNPDLFIILDTLVLCKMIWPADVLIGPDMKLFHSGKMPGKLLKRQSLAAWGCRLGNNKGEYTGGWATWSLDMQTYMVQDGKVNADLWKLIIRRLGWTNGGNDTGLPSGSSGTPQEPQKPGSGPNVYVWPWMPIWIEMEMAKIITEQEDVGVGFDRRAAEAFATDLKNRQDGLTQSLREGFGSWWAPLDDPQKGRKITRTVVRVKKSDPTLHGTVAKLASERYALFKGLKKVPNFEGEHPREYHFEGSLHCRIVYTEFNPNSRDHLGDRLKRVYGWKPDIFTANGKPQVDETVIKSISSKIINEDFRHTILDYFVVTKTLGQLNDGKKSWMDFANPKTGCIHGRCDPLGTITHRAAHFNPNLGQIPAVDVKETKDASGKIISKEPIKGLEGRFGYECRVLFIPGGLVEHPLEWRKPMVEMTGSDVHSLEFVMLGHELAPYDAGEFRDRASDPDADLHEEHAKRATEAGNPTTRQEGKTLGFLIIYGGGALKAGEGMGVDEDEIGTLLQDKGLPNRLRFMKKRMGRAYTEPTDLQKAQIVKGARGIKSIKDAIPGLEDLMKDTMAFAEEHGYIIAIDGRKLVTRKPYAALNTKLQGGGSIACKLWQILFHQKMKAAGYRLRVNYNQMLWVHDETQNDHIVGLGPVIAKLQEEAAGEAATILKINGTLRTESKTGKSWAECH